MEILKEKRDDFFVYTLKGRLDTQSSPEFQSVLEEGFKNDEKKLIFDFKDLEYMSSAGLRTILYAKKCIDSEEAEEGENEEIVKTGCLKLINVSDEIMEVFTMTGFDEFLSINEE